MVQAKIEEVSSQPFTHSLWLIDRFFFFFHLRADGSYSQWYNGVLGILSSVRNYATLFLLTTQHSASYSNLYLNMLLGFFFLQSKHSISSSLF